MNTTTCITEIVAGVPVELRLEHNTTDEVIGCAGSTKVLTDQITEEMRKGKSDGTIKVPIRAWYHFSARKSPLKRFLLGGGDEISWKAKLQNA